MVKVNVPGNRTQEQSSQLNYPNALETSQDTKRHKQDTNQSPRGPTGMFFAIHHEKKVKRTKPLEQIDRGRTRISQSHIKRRLENWRSLVNG